MTNRKGIHRHEALQPLSRHHMMGLHVGLKLSRAGTAESNIPTEQIIEDTMEFWCLGVKSIFAKKRKSYYQHMLYMKIFINQKLSKRSLNMY